VSKNISIRFLVVLPVLAFIAFVVAVADLGALAQNTNSSPTEDSTVQAENANAAPRPRARRGRRRAARAARAARATAVDPSESPVDPSEAPSDGMTRGVSLGQETDTGVSSPGEAADLSGTYTGRIRMSGGHEMSGNGTLTITGNQFSLEAEGMTHSGRIIAITTRGYTGATLWFSDQTDSATNTMMAFSVRVRKGRNTITMTPVPGVRNRFWFNGRSG
jgi:hypothetical protein